jgi:hypothetical protein
MPKLLTIKTKNYGDDLIYTYFKVIMVLDTKMQCGNYLRKWKVVPNYFI